MVMPRSTNPKKMTAAESVHCRHLIVTAYALIAVTTVTRGILSLHRTFLAQFNVHLPAETNIEMNQPGKYTRYVALHLGI